MEHTVFIDRNKIQKRIKELGGEIGRFYKDKTPFQLITVLKGGFIFLADLVREINLPLEVDFTQISTYENQTQSSGKIKFIKKITEPVTNKHVLIVEDIIDTGFTLNFLYKEIKKQNPKSIEIAALLVKKNKHKLKYPIHFTGFEIEDKFVIGYGLDYQGMYRNLPFISILE
ncbi:MAG: hypoxanthine phosphoribosyltransferase [Spirochaetia bacterium]|nr:hypoxanthine phosphoribosyltransferase [Spirochaetia bacterium]